MSEKIKIIVNGEVRSADAGSLLSQIIDGEMPCGGHGRCGKCRVIAKGNLSSPTEAELGHLSPEELAGGTRLSCMTRALGDCEVTTREAEKTQILTDTDLPAFTVKPTFESYGVAIDIGTTTVAARLYDGTGKPLADATRLNPQQKWGADVVSRIEASLRGDAAELAAAVRHSLDGIIRELASAAKIGTDRIDGVVITGNTVMLSLLCGESVLPFSAAPFEAKRLFGEDIPARELGITCLNGELPVYLAPCISAFVGADVVCAAVSTRLCSGDTAMLADIGTNGEIALWNGGGLTVCSTAAGPAFEGVGISMGMRGDSGAIDRVRAENGKLIFHTINGKEPIGICGSGLVDAIACMLEIGALDEGGYLEDDRFVIGGAVCLCPQDIRMFQLAKSAIYAGIASLIKEGGIRTDEVHALYIAGGFGSYLDHGNAVRVGLIPRELGRVTRAVGNAALAGASMLLLSAEERRGAEALAKSAEVLDLSTNPTFSGLFFAGMSLEPM